MWRAPGTGRPSGRSSARADEGPFLGPAARGLRSDGRLGLLPVLVDRPVVEAVGILQGPDLLRNDAAFRIDGERLLEEADGVVDPLAGEVVRADLHEEL